MTMETTTSSTILLLLVVLLTSSVSSFFVPEQLPTLLSFVYTNIPPIRKGIDSRVGFGFRLGPNADVQVMVELGPQQNTAPIGPQKADGSSKRETRLPSYKYRPPPSKGSWLQAWKQQQGLFDEGDDVGVMPAQPPMDQDVMAHLHQLYKQQPVVRDGRNLLRNEVETGDVVNIEMEAVDNTSVDEAELPNEKEPSTQQKISPPSDQPKVEDGIS